MALSSAMFRSKKSRTLDRSRARLYSLAICMDPPISRSMDWISKSSSDARSGSTGNLGKKREHDRNVVPSEAVRRNVGGGEEHDLPIERSQELAHVLCRAMELLPVRVVDDHPVLSSGYVTRSNAKAPIQGQART